MQNLARRALVTFTLGPLTLLLVYKGGWYYFLPFALLLAIALTEYVRLVDKQGLRAPIWLLLPVAFALWFVPLPVQRILFASGGLKIDLVPIVLLLGLLAGLLYALWLYERRPEEDATGSWLAIVGGIMLLGWVGSHFFQLRGLENMAIQWTSLAMLATWIADSGAYVFGKTLGRHKLSPRLSPNKTIEGYVSGIIVGTSLTVLLAWFLELPISSAAVLGLLASGVSPAGDLGISMLKRTVGVKDSGQLLLSHGGALDRIDSLLWSVLMAYYLVIFTS